MNPIDAVKARLDDGRLWLKGEVGEYDLPDHPVCLRGGCIAVSLAHVPSWVLADAIGKVIGEQYPDRSHEDEYADWDVAAFNDHPDTTWLDVERVLEKASVLWDEAHS